MPNGHRTNPKGASQDESSGGEHGKSAEAAYPAYSEERILDAISKFSAYLREERERYRPEGRKLGDAASALFGKFFSPKLLRQVRVVALSGRRLANPAFYGQARAFGVFNLPEMAHKTSATFLDVIVFNERITNRELFHGLVHAAQVQVLGKRFFAELFVRGMMRTRSYSLTPMKAQAFALDARFAANPAGAFSVEDEVRAWLSEARY